MNNKLFHFNPEDTKAVDSVINEALDDFVLREGVFFKKKLQTPYKGWVAVFYDNFILKSLFYQSEHGSKLIEANWSECGKPVNKISKIENVLSMFFEKDGEILIKGKLNKSGVKEGPWQSYFKEAVILGRTKKLKGEWVKFEKKTYLDGELQGEILWTPSRLQSTCEFQGLIDHVFSSAMDNTIEDDFHKSYNIDLHITEAIGNYERGVKIGKWYLKTAKNSIVGNFNKGGLADGLWKLHGHESDKVLIEVKMNKNSKEKVRTQKRSSS